MEILILSLLEQYINMQQKYVSSAFDVKRTRDMSNLTISYGLQSIWLSLLIALDT